MTPIPLLRAMARRASSMAFVLICALAPLPPSAAEARGFRVLHAFTDGADGATSNAPVILDKSGNLFGTALQGGASNNGVVFEITAKGHESVLYSFAAGSDGRRPEAGVIEDSSGNLYGTTNQGGPADLGIVFRLAPGGTETVLYAFTGGSDGAQPQASLIADKAGDLHGTTTFAGGDGCGGQGCGTIFKVAANGTFTVLHDFAETEGASPQAGLIADKRGNFYGTADWGGANGYGSIFEFDTKGTFEVLYSFTGGDDGAFPQAGLIADKSGNFYGTTRSGGGSNPCGTYGCGTIFRFDPSGRETVIYAFSGGTDGGEPYGGVAADSTGNLYGTTVTGGNSQGLGVVFKLASSGTLATLHTFEGTSDGAWPEAGVVLDRSNNVFGTAYAEGPDGWGTVFEMKR